MRETGRDTFWDLGKEEPYLNVLESPGNKAWERNKHWVMIWIYIVDM